MNPRKRQREPVTVDAEAVAIYEDLANEDEEIRLKAAKALLSRLGPEFSDTEAVQKALTRLFRGLCSGRKAARLGFSVALTELLAQHVREGAVPAANNVLVENVLNILDLQSRITGSISGQEERDHYLGRLFGAEAIIKSGIFALPDIACNHWERLLQLIFDLEKKKTWLREECGWVLYGALKGRKLLSEDHAKTLIEKLHLNGLTKTPEGVALWLVVQSNYPGIQLPKHVWHHGNPLHRKEKVSLAQVLKETTSPYETDKVTRSNWLPQIHFAWEVVFEALPKAHSENINFSDLWTEAVENGLFALTSSDEKKFWGFLLVQKYLLGLPVDDLTVIIAPNTVRCLTNQMAWKSRYLHRAAEKTLKTLHERIQKDPKVAVIFIDKLFQAGYANFDSLTKTKTVEKLITQVGHEGLEEFIPLCRRAIYLPQTQDAKIAAAGRQVVIEYLVSTTKSRISAKGQLDLDSSILDVLKLLSVLAYSNLDISDDPKLSVPVPTLANATRDVAKSRLTTLLGRLTAKSNDAFVYPYTLLNYLNQLLDDHERKTLLLPFEKESEVGRTVMEANRILQDLHNEVVPVEGRQKEQLNAFKLLYSLTILDVYNGDTEAVSILDELRVCYEKLYTSKSEQEEGSEILMEIILSLVSKQSVMLKRLAHRLFSACTSEINSNGLRSLINVLETPETLSGQYDIFEAVDEQDTEGKELDEVDSDVEMIDDANGEPGRDLEDDEANLSGSDPEEPISDSDNDADTELAEFNAKLAQALGTRRLDQDLAADEDEAADEDMNDEQMEALDIQLENIFKERKRAKVSKKQRQEAKERVILFKKGVLELLDIYTKREYRQALPLDLVLPLLTLIRTTSNKQVSEKAGNIIREYCHRYGITSKNKLSGSPLLVGTTSLLLEQIHAAAMLEGSSGYGNACSLASLLVIKVFIVNGGRPEVAVDRYAVTQKKFLLASDCHVRTSFFSDWLNWCTSAREKLGSGLKGKPGDV